MGIYQSEMIFPSSLEFPFAVPKFCVLVKYYEKLGVFSDDLSLRVFLPGDIPEKPSIVNPLARADFAKVDPSAPLEADQERILNLTFPVVMAPLTFRQSGFVKVRIVCGDLTTNLGSIFVRKQRADEAISFA